MIMDRPEFLRRARIDTDTIELWLDAGWLAQRGASGEWTAFSEIDLARSRLIQDLTRDLGVNDQGVPIILDLIDQLHGLRSALRDLLVALLTQPTNTRERLVAELRAVRLQPDGYGASEGS
jgi:chaperone modulatory protein CbpM